MKVLVTGHTGFKGAWLTLLLQELGHEVSGFSLTPEPGSLYESASIKGTIAAESFSDLRDVASLNQFLENSDAEILIHLAAQPIVKKSYEEPVESFETNAIGTMNVLEFARNSAKFRVVLVITTDKVYKIDGRQTGYSEVDALGGVDPYSASKAMADILTQSYVSSFKLEGVGIGRAGNVIGGGDSSPNRLLPDVVSAAFSGIPITLRYPESVRPWQHVLDCLFGYILAIEKLLQDSRSEIWNFGPEPTSEVTVREIVVAAFDYLGMSPNVKIDSGLHPIETAVLKLDSSKARNQLGWTDLLPFPESLGWTLSWHEQVRAGEDARDVTLRDIRNYLSRARINNPEIFQTGKLLSSTTKNTSN